MDVLFVISNFLNESIVRSFLQSLRLGPMRVTLLNGFVKLLYVSAL